MAIGPDGRLYVSSRFEGAVYRIDDAGSHEQVASDLGVACGIAFDRDGSMYVGDGRARSSACVTARRRRLPTIPASVAAFHLAMSAGAGAVRDGADAERLRLRVPDRSGGTGADAAVAARAVRRGWRSRPTDRCTWSTRSRARAACTGLRISTRRRRWSCRAARSSALRSARRAKSSSPRTKPLTVLK